MKSKTDTADPMRNQLRTDKEEPRVEHSITDRAKTEPTRVSPMTERVEPRRENPRIDMDDPMLLKS